MQPDPQKVAEYERIIPLCMQPLVGKMPGLDVVVRDDLVLTSSLEYPSPDANQAFLLRGTEQTIDGLIDEVIEYFRAKEIPPAIFISPACTPADLPQRLLKRGFVKQEPAESWPVFEHLQAAKKPKTNPKIVVQQVDKSDVELFSQVMVAAYEMPSEWVPMMTRILGPSVGEPGFYHYLAYIDKKPIATLTIMRYQDYAIAGSAGVLPEHRGSSVIFNLAVNVLAQAQKEGVDTVLGQTTLGPMFERFLRIWGFKIAFKRTGYILE